MGPPLATLYLNQHVRLGEALIGPCHTGPMKRIIAALALAVTLAAPAAASPLSEQVQAEASRLLTQVTAAEKAARARPGAKPAALAPALTADLQRFGLAASRLSGEIDKTGGPKDLRCIFRGMADEAGNQLAAASAAVTGADQAKALARLSHMLKDAVEIAPAVGGKATAASSTRAAAATCPATVD